METMRYLMSAVSFATALVFCISACNSNEAKDWLAVAAWAVTGIYWLLFALVS